MSNVPLSALVGPVGLERPGLGRDVDPLRGADPAGDGQGIVGDVGRDDLGRAAVARHEDDEHTDRAAPRHEDPLALDRPRLRRGVEADGQGLRHRRLGHAHLIRDRDRLLGPDRQTLSEAALGMGEAHRASDEVHIQALMPHPLAAVTAAPARSARVHGDAGAGRHRRHPCADLHDGAGDLVAEHHRLLDPHGAEAAMVEIVQVRAADAARLDRDADLVGSGRDRRHGLDPQVLRGVDDDAER
jgi:hypothetical protein